MTVQNPAQMKNTPGIYFLFGAVLICLALVQYIVPVPHSMADVRPSQKAFQQGKSRPRPPQPEGLSQSIANASTNTVTATLDHKTGPRYQVVFSSSCSEQQNWEAYMFFYHAYKVKQPGNVTRIASACEAREAKELSDFFHKHIAPLNPGNFHLHLTPDYGTVAKAHGHYYKYMNKPFGLRHWMEHTLHMNPDTLQARQRRVEDDIVILMDPDMILLQPITHDYSNVREHIWADKPESSAILTRVVRHGFPMAQQDGYLSNHWMTLDAAYITNKTSTEHQPMPSKKDGPIHWNTGPPYLATVRDMYQIVTKWTDYAPRVVHVYPELFAEMYGFIYATIELKLPFTLIKSLVVSVTTTPQREGWAFIDAIEEKDICHPPSDARMPIALHYCNRYSLGKHFFSKYRLKKNILNCEKPLLKPPREDLAMQKLDYSIAPPRADLSDKDTYKEQKTPLKNRNRQAKREAFMLCSLTRSINEALIHFKRRACGDRGNFDETYTIYNDPSTH